MTDMLRCVEDFDVVLDAHAFAPRDPDAAFFLAFRCSGARFGREPFRDFGTVGDGAEDLFGGGVEFDRDFEVAGVFLVHSGDS
jgi:hypothetical protein